MLRFFIFNVEFINTLI